jgi:hypothetical protein
VAIGLTAAEVTDLQTKTDAAAAALAAQLEAQNASKVATQALKDAVDAMQTTGAAMIVQIRAKAANGGGNEVYNLAEIPVPATPSPAGPPGKPGSFTAELNEDGSLSIKWKCASPGGGVTYQVYRRVTATGEFAYQANTGVKEFVDTTIPAGSSQVTYQVRAIRPTAAGAWAQFNVNFGAGGVVVSSSEEKMPRIAA